MGIFGDGKGCMKNRKKPTVGQVLWVVERAWRGKTCGYNCSVSKVGRKYFTVKSDPEHISSGARFHNDTWNEDCNTNYPLTLYENEQEYSEKIEKDKLESEMRYFFTYNKISLDQLRRIKKIIDEPTTSICRG